MAVVIMWRTYILLERLLVDYACTLTHDIIQIYNNVFLYIGCIFTFYCIHIMLSSYLIWVYRIHSDFHNIYFAIDCG